MRILIAGGSGFIGREVVRQLSRVKGVEILCISRSPLLDLPESVLTLPCDWGNAYEVADIFDFSPHVLVNLVGGSHPRSSIGSSASEVEKYILPFMRLVEALQLQSLRKVVFASSAGAIYPSQVDIPLVEYPATPYAATKIAVESYLRALSSCTNLVALSMRISNPVGVGNEKNGFGVVQTFANKIINEESVTFFNDADVKKDYIAVEDVASAFCLAIQDQIDDGTYKCFDIGSGFSFSARDIYEILLSYRGGKISSLRYFGKSALNIQETFNGLNWTPNQDVINSFYEVYDSLITQSKA